MNPLTPSWKRCCYLLQGHLWFLMHAKQCQLLARVGEHAMNGKVGEQPGSLCPLKSPILWAERGSLPLHCHFEGGRGVVLPR